jgi:hypothetical protein
MTTVNGFTWREVDMRSDTVTKPTPEMREAMKNAVVGRIINNTSKNFIFLLSRFKFLETLIFSIFHLFLVV